jgi:phage terminase large subunit-like protein
LRSWYALFQGVPAAPEGGLIKRQWLDDWRLPAAPQLPLLTVVGVDPADSGEGDACGLVAASMTAEGVIAMIADQSAPMTSDQWARAAVELAADVGASEIAVEGFAPRETYVRVVNDALRRYRINRPVRVTSWPPRGSGRGGGDALARSAALLQALEVGTCRLAGHFPTFEEAAVTWQAGQHQPDALAALVVGHDVLVHAAGRQMHVAIPDLTAKLGDRAAITPIPGYLRRRVGEGRRADVARHLAAPGHESI